MGFKNVIVHTCFDLITALRCVHPFTTALRDKKDMEELWKDAQKQIGKRPDKCRCSYRFSETETQALISQGLAAYTVLDWFWDPKYDAFQPRPNRYEITWLGQPLENEKPYTTHSYGIIDHTDPRLWSVLDVLHILRAHVISRGDIEKAYIEEDQEVADWIDIYGQLNAEVTRSFIKKENHRTSV